MAPMSEQPDRERASADEHRLGELLRAVEAPAPGPLRALIAELNAGSVSRRRVRMPVLAFGGAFAAAAIAAVVIVLAVGGTSTPTALRTAELALAQPRASAPKTLVAAGTNIAFPDWAARGWPSAGLRRDRLGGRMVTTEFYRSYASGTVGYAIVSGSPLRFGEGGRTVVRSHGEYRLMRSGGARVVAWVQEGHTCVLASRTASPATLLRLAVAQEGTSTVSEQQGWGLPQQPTAARV
jgi:hypothetical protein